jgi:hypothetical protein
MHSHPALSARPDTAASILGGLFSGLVVAGGLLTFLACNDGPRHDPELAAAVTELQQASAELRQSAADLRASAEALSTAAKAMEGPTLAQLMDTAMKMAPFDPPEFRGIPGSEEAIQCESDLACTIDRAFVEGLLADPSQLTKQTRIMPSIKDGVTRGLKLYGIRPDSLPKLLGFKNGDLIVRVDGTDLTGMDAAMAAYSRLRKSDRVEVVVDRRGETFTKVITLR